MKRCAGCKKVWYCGTRCQKEHWSMHIFDCKVGQPISTAYHLARAMHLDVVPVDPQTRFDYGFEKAERMLGVESAGKLCGLYQGLFICEVTPKQLREWQRDGRLVEGIKATFEALPANNRGGYYPWFLQNQHIFDGTPVDEGLAAEIVENTLDNMLRAAWNFLGKSPRASIADIKAYRVGSSAEVRACFDLYSHLLCSFRPTPAMFLWVSFGFVEALSRDYQTLIRRCTFGEFCTAYTSSSIPALFDRYRITPRGHKSVWDLKHYVDQLLAGDEPPLIPPVRCDYGYGNCRNASEVTLLDELYKMLFRKRVDPLALHEACVGGELLEFAKKHVKLSPSTAKYARLLKNPYPLPSVDGLSPGRLFAANELKTMMVFLVLNYDVRFAEEGKCPAIIRFGPADLPSHTAKARFRKRAAPASVS
ncbi:hypothetical protein C8Q80DRAFT_1222771 [Daedaleopsis nitida]|nr:hypothetical protein C8Q80DRAFT_1222771 [Daedaleopsis nitida]